MIRVSPFFKIHPLRHLCPQCHLLYYVLSTILYQHPPHLAMRPEGLTTNLTLQPQQPQPQQEQLARALTRVTPSRSPSLPMFGFDLRNMLSHFSPAQFQQLFAYWPCFKHSLNSKHPKFLKFFFSHNRKGNPTATLRCDVI